MKSYFFIFILTPFFCFAQQNKQQTTENKSSATDCPTWKKKDVKTNKADYFQYLKTSKSQKSMPAVTSNPAKDKSVNPRQKIKNEESVVQENNTISQTNTTTKEKTVPEQKNKTVATKKDREVPVIDDKQNSVVSMPQNKSEEDDKIIAKTAKAGEQTTDSEKALKSDSNKNEKLEDEKTKAKQKLTRLTRKTTKVRKHSNAKCPSF
ncbi:MAG: hypothetical protein WBM13_00950 [Bacteroidia bacterium]